MLSNWRPLPFQGTFTFNAPDTVSTAGALRIITGTGVGSYTANCDVTGLITRTLTRATAAVTAQFNDFVTTRAKALGNGRLLAIDSSTARACQCARSGRIVRVPQLHSPSRLRRTGGLILKYAAVVAGTWSVRRFLNEGAALQRGASVVSRR
jgi:hypothetical protein